MPTYEYSCRSGHQWDVIKPVAQLDELETCPSCLASGDRRISRVNFTGAADWNTQTWHPALGRYVKSNAEARKIAKAAGMEEVGTEKPETIHKHYDQQREAKREQMWQDATRDKLYD